ncbi:hypothetical protein L249_7105 [Ophiocordyceps polyrhachis-furcata BCC 54312]|uniref:SEC7 domain-containing protein n=1 Tax=Ophiocordyceps polyrhachis-furcata BCC 54312 TaxID=1330021 RepID=A0A367LKK7_9HYPO|nr:hypothetical protein L249_7105 [Ophiocordyceps polyrhachis-furcata BCC 54312]
MKRDDQFKSDSSAAIPLAHASDIPRMSYRSRPVTISVDPTSLVISECISITSAIQKHAPHSSVSAILGGSPSPIQLVTSSVVPGSRSRVATPVTRTEDGNPEAIVTNNRWGLRGHRGKSMQDNPMVAGFGKLRHEIAAAKDIHSLDAPSLLAPFLQVLQAKGTAAPITILALGALRKFLAYGFIGIESPRIAVAMQSLSAAVTHCQFDVSDSTQGEVVLLMILSLMEDMMSGPGGYILSDESVCDIMGRGLAICSQPRFSPVLRRTAEASMIRMCQIIFEDVKHLEGAKAWNDSEKPDQRFCKMEQMTPICPQTRSSHEDDYDINSAALSTSSPPSLERTAASGPEDPISTPSPDVGSEEADDSQSMDLQPYSLPSVRELFRVLVNFLDPNDRQHTDTMRVVALRILHVALEVSGPFIARLPALAIIVEDRLCCYLFQLVRSDNMAVLQESLIVAGTLLATCRGILKLQQELFLSYLVACLHPTVHIPRETGIDPSLYSDIPETPNLVKQPASQRDSGRSTPVSIKDRQKLGLEGGTRKPDARQAMVEGIGVLSRMPTFVTELFVNYDCDEDRADLCEDLIGLLSRNALPDSATWSTTSVPPLCLDALLRYIQFLAERTQDNPAFERSFPDPAQLRERRRRKNIIVKGAIKFNEKPKVGLRYLEAHGIIADVGDPVGVARFLQGTSRVSKSVLGDFLSKRGNEAVLGAFIDQFDFSEKRIDEALRVLLETFRLPGEAPLIASIVESFSEKYCRGNTLNNVANKDAVFILTYAIIILNTDQHNPNLKASKRMTFEDFSRNLRGQNSGQDFSRTFLQDIFDSIRLNEIILPDEHDNKHAFDYAWRELLSKSASAGNLIMCDTNIYDADMFTATWKPILSTLSYVFMSATDDAVFARIVAGFDDCARIADKYENTEALDQLVYCLSLMSTLATEITCNTSLNTEVQVGNGSVMVSELAVKLGSNFRAQLAMLVLFRVVTNREALLRRSWKHIVTIWRNLFINSLIPSLASACHPPLIIPSIPLQTPSQTIDRASRSTESGFFSAFTSYISSYAADDPPEPSEEELDSTLCTVDCINLCGMSNVFRNVMNLPAQSTSSLARALLDQIPENDRVAVISVKQDSVPSPPSINQGPTVVAPAYDPSTVFILEFVTILATRDDASVEAVGKDVFDVLQTLLRDFTNWHPIMLSRAAFYTFLILKHGYDHDFINVPFLLHSINSLTRDLLFRSSEVILQGLAICTDQPGPLRSEIMTSPDFWAIMRVLAGNLDSAALVFRVLEKGSTGSPPAIMAENYEPAVSLLVHFASGAKPHESVGDKEYVPERKMKKDPSIRDKQSIERACKAVEILHGMTGRVPQLMHQSHLESSEAWATYWLPIFQALTTQCTNPVRDVRQLAFSAMQRSLLSPELACSDVKDWSAVFDKVLFPLVFRLLKPEIFSLDREGMSDMRVQSASLLCKVFLQYLVLFSDWNGMLDLWIKIIEVMDRLMNSGQGDSLEEAVRENVKNVVLYMASIGCLARTDTTRVDVWEETWRRLDRFLPDLRKDLLADDLGKDHVASDLQSKREVASD